MLPYAGLTTATVTRSRPSWAQGLPVSGTPIESSVPLEHTLSATLLHHRHTAPAKNFVISAPPPNNNQYLCDANSETARPSHASHHDHAELGERAGVGALAGARGAF